MLYWVTAGFTVDCPLYTETPIFFLVRYVILLNLHFSTCSYLSVSGRKEDTKLRHPGWPEKCLVFLSLIFFTLNDSHKSEYFFYEYLYTQNDSNLWLRAIIIDFIHINMHYKEWIHNFKFHITTSFSLTTLIFICFGEPRFDVDY